MTKLREMICECLCMLEQCSIPEIQVINAEWQRELEKKNATRRIKLLCAEMCRLVIEKKQQRQGRLEFDKN